MVIPAVTILTVAALFGFNMIFGIWRLAADDWSGAFAPIIYGRLLGVPLGCAVAYLYWKGYLPTWVAIAFVSLGLAFVVFGLFGGVARWNHPPSN